MKLKILAAITALVASGSSLASPTDAIEIDGVIKDLAGC
jgi:hypothetical protein